MQGQPARHALREAQRDSEAQVNSGRPAGLPTRGDGQSFLPPNHLVPGPIGMYDPANEHDACGVGFVAQIDGTPSHRVLELGIRAVCNVMHRGALDADAKTGDGAGVLTQVPRALLMRELAAKGITGVAPEDMAVAMIFFPNEPRGLVETCRAIIEKVCDRHGLRRLAWRIVPINREVLGAKALATVPDVEQLILGRPLGQDDNDFERTLFLARKEIERRVNSESIGSFYIPSMSRNTVVYKGLLAATQLPAFYQDLTDPDYTTAICVFHQRYSTNTFPNWFLAQPFRMLAHNGEINTLQGNRNWMAAREPELASPQWRDAIEWLKPICWAGGSDSTSLDDALELLNHSGRDALHSMMMLVPEAWEHMPDMDEARRAFYQYHACLIEPWDGPAALAFSDGTVAAAALDRNGLRPSRYKITRDGLVILGSEAGIVEVDDADCIEKGRLGPGQMIAVDTSTGQVYHNDEIKERYANRQPYGEWLARNFVHLETRVDHDTPEVDGSLPAAPPREDLPALWRAFGYTFEDIKYVVEPMGHDGEDNKWSMGDDTPLAVLSHKPRPLYVYFRQRFAQVTNPPIDPLREGVVMSLDTFLGRRHNLLEETEGHASLLAVSTPVLLDDEFVALTRPEFGATVIDTLFDPYGGEEALDRAIDDVCAAATRAVDAGSTLIVLSDRRTAPGHAPIPALLATAAVHHHLIREDKRMRADIIVQTGEAWDIHHLACLVGYGAGAIHPYLALATTRSLEGERGYEKLSAAELEGNYRKAANKGLLRIMSKMGITSIASYRGAQIFEAVGIAQTLIDRCFTGTPSRIGGIGLAEIATDVANRHEEGFGAPAIGRLPNLGFVNYRKDGEVHGYNRQAVIAMQEASKTGNYDDYRKFESLVNGGAPRALRDIMEWSPVGPPVPIDEVEPIAAIISRFNTTAMSLGALSPEAHQTLAIAMNRIGAKSNTGEGGEDPDWWKPFPDGPYKGERANSKIKQVASGRFGVTPEYLQQAEELEIKMAQGAKPGEGGQIPATKVTPLIARLRHAIPGITLVSPPPHHDIYSIEDLAQLIYDLKAANPRAKVGVKLVAETGVGTIAAGVAKAYADYILIAGHDGGTGASPLSSIKHAGCPWEMGLAETQQVLVLNGLRGRVRLRTDGGMKTGRDIIMAALLGAEEYGFGTGAVIAIGCDMARQCHLNTCPTGIATQRADLRAKFTGVPEMVIHFLSHIAQDVREILASMGARSLDEIIGRSTLLQQSWLADHPRANLLDLTALTTDVDPNRRYAHRCEQPRNDRPGDVMLDDELREAAEPALAGLHPVTLDVKVRTSHRTVGARLSGEIARRHGDAGLPDGMLTIRATGSAGQSFGAFLTPGVTLTLEGESNDYVGKGMHGGRIVVTPPANAAFAGHRNSLIGNTVLYGATGGQLFVSGRAGERFAVRNSGAHAVVEGAGDHCCEYMTGGVVVVLGETGRNFAAGMSAGLAYVLDETSQFPAKVNRDMVGVERLEKGSEAEASVRKLIALHAEATGSARASNIIAQWDHFGPLFWAVVPHTPQIDTTLLPSHVAARAAAAAR